MSCREQLPQNLLGVLVLLSHDSLLHQADLAGDLGDHVRFAVCDRGHDRVGETERRGGVQPTAVHSRCDCVGLPQRRLEGHLWIKGSMDGDQKVFADELVQFEIVHMAAGADLGCVHDDEQVVRIDMHSGNVVAVLAFADRYRMEVELARQQRLGIVAPFGKVEPKEPVGALPQVRQLGQIMVAHAFGVDPAQLHGEPPFHIFYTTPPAMPLQRAPAQGGAAV
jgi:hypothetical protein